MAQEKQAALVACGTDAIGQAVARELLRRDWLVVLGGGRNDLQAAAERLAPAGAADQLATYPAELTSPDDREQLVEFALGQFGRLDLLVVTAQAPSADENLLELSEDALRRALDGQLTGPLFLAQRVANEMVRLVEAGDIEAGRIVLVNSILAEATSPDRAAECLASAGVAMLVKLLAEVLGEHGVTVYEIRAGFISTGRADDAHARLDARIADGLVPTRRWGRPQDVALAVAAVAEDLLPYSTGEVIHADGGCHLKRL